MAQFDVFRSTDGNLLLDCQSDALSHLATRMVVPLVPLDRSPERRARLNPVFDIGEEPHVLLTQFAAAVRHKELKTRVASLLPYRFDIISAFDMMLTGV
jgi:toxin CcdB